ncbi:hypothetical protein VNO77_03403 [Canavalia gladiata]|uniref:Uncharacterized protein n=1 Tax=Canavalia gladiata TaxID=3824 RepID=A0AAN9MUP2_CANGL
MTFSGVNIMSKRLRCIARVTVATHNQDINSGKDLTKLLESYVLHSIKLISVEARTLMLELLVSHLIVKDLAAVVNPMMVAIVQTEGEHVASITPMKPEAVIVLRKMCIGHASRFVDTSMYEVNNISSRNLQGVSALEPKGCRGSELPELVGMAACGYGVYVHSAWM